MGCFNGCFSLIGGRTKSIAGYSYATKDDGTGGYSYWRYLHN